jgi:two-component sensor histidine kinase
MGLSLVSTLVTQLDGKIELDGNAGTSFTITFQYAAFKDRL